MWLKPTDRQVYLQALERGFSRPLRRSGEAQRLQETKSHPLELAAGIPTKAPATDDPVWGCLMKNARAISALQIKGPFIYYHAPLRVSINFFSQSKFTGNRQFRIYVCNDGYMGH